MHIFHFRLLQATFFLTKVGIANNDRVPPPAPTLPWSEETIFSKTKDGGSPLNTYRNVILELQIHGRGQNNKVNKQVDENSESKAKAGRPDCVPAQVQALQDVRDLGGEERWQVAGSLRWRLWRTSHVPDTIQDP